MYTNNTTFRIKALFTVFVALFFSISSIDFALCNSVSVKNKSKNVYKKEANKVASSHEWVSFHLHVKRCLSDSIIWEKEERIILEYHSTNPLVFIQDKTSGKYSYLDPNAYKVVDMDNQEIVDISKTDKAGRIAYRELGEFGFLPNYFYDIPYYLIPMKQFNKLFINMPLRQTSTKETIDGESVVRTSHYGKDRIIVSVINATTHLLQRVSKTDGDYKTDYVFSEYDFDNRRNLIDSIFDFDNPQYAKFSRRYGFRVGTTNTELNKEISAYPIIGMHLDTITVSQAKGWLLLDFWSFNCSPCIETLHKFGAEKRNSGKRRLEEEGISIYAINHRSDNFETIKSIGEKTNTLDIMFSAKNIDSVISIPYLGYYYLVSPDKNVVWHSNSLNDYSALLEAKANYERRHQNK